MKTTLHYIIAILLFSLNATHAFAEGEEEPFNITYKDNNVTYSYNDEKTLLTISGDGEIKIEGDGKTVNCGIVIEGVVLTIKDLNINTNNTPLVFERVNNECAEYQLYLEGTNILESTNGPGINLNGNTVKIEGSGSLKVIGGGAASGIEGNVKFSNNACVVAIGGEGASGGINPAPNSNTLTSGLLISGTKQPGGSIKQDYSELKGDLTLAADLEIPEWAEVTIPQNQSITIPEGKTLTNNGAIINNGTLTQTGTFINNGTLTENGIITSNKSLNIEGEEGFDVSTEDDGTTFKYDKQNNLLTISGSSSVLLKGRNKDKAVNCGIVIEEAALTIKDLNINTNNTPLVYEKVNSVVREVDFCLEGTNILESTNGSGINLNGNTVKIKGSGSLKVIGGNGAYGIQGKIEIYDNACVVAIGGEGASGGINPAPTHTSGLLIYGTKQGDGSIKQDYSKLKGNITLSGNLEIPKGATVNIADEQTFTIADGVTLTNYGTITNNGTLHNNGIFLNNGTLTGNQPKHHITFKANDSASTADDERYITEGEPLPTDIFTRSGYTFQGWFTDPDGGTKVEKVTQPQTLYAQWKADEPAVDPEPPYVPPYVPPTPIYYSVYLPLVEGASTDPGPGEYEVESWSTFRFYLTIDSAYSESQPVVTTDRGETLVPRSSDGAYLVKYVRTDVEVFIDGLIQNPPPVANEAIGTDALAPQIWTDGSMLCIRMAEALPSAPVRIFTVDGRLYDSFDSTPGLSRRQLPTGVYIVRVGETACKVIIK